MHHRALRHLPPTVAISQWTFGSAPSFTQALQAAAGQAWLRRVPLHTKASSSAGKHPILSHSRYSRGCGSPGPDRKVVSDEFLERGFTAGARDALVHVEVEPETKERQVPDTHVSPMSNSAVDSLDTRKSNLPSSKPPHTRHGACLSGQRVQTRPAVPPKSTQIDMVTNEDHNSEAQDINTLQASITTPTPRTPRTISASIPQAPISHHLPKPDSWIDLYKNLRLSLNLRPLPTLPALIDYHDAYPKFRSRHSYNLLIELSIRHSQFGTTRWLFDAMMHDNLSRDFNTRVLEARFLVRTGKWEIAWSRATGLTPEEALDKPLRNGRAPIKTKVPVEMWKELLCTEKQGAIRRPRDIRWGVDEAGNRISLPPQEVVNDPATPGTEAYLRQQKLLSCIQPSFGSGHKSIPVRPQLVKYVVSWMLSDGRRAEAIALVESYLSKLPPHLRKETAAQCMDIIHTLLSRNPNFNANYKLLLQLLKTYPSLKPSSTTLRLILVPLKKFTKCGSLALNIIRSFQERWGDQIIDGSVRRKVANLAEKQGLMLVVKRMMQEDQTARRVVHAAATADAPLSQKVEDTRGLRRPPDRELFTRQSFEIGQWRKLRLRVRRKHHRDAQEYIPK